MSLIKQQEHSALLQVQGELDRSFLKARTLLEKFIEKQDDLEPIQVCSEILEEAKGVLIVVEIYGAASLAEEMVAVTDAISKGKVKRINDAIEALMMAGVKLPEYLEKVASGAPDSAMYLLPALNDLRASIDEGLLSETSIFAPDLDEKLKQIPQSNQINETLQAIIKKNRINYHKGLLFWYKNNDINKGVGELKNVINLYRQEASSPLSTHFFNAAHALTIGLMEGYLESGVALKQLFGAIDRAIKPALVQGESSFNQSIPIDLWRNALFYLSTIEEQDNSELNEDCKDLRENGILISQLDSNAHDFAGQSMLEGVQKALQEDIVVIIDALDLFIRSDRSRKESVSDLAEPLARMGDTLNIVGQGALSVRLKSISEQAEEVAKEVKEEDLLSLAEELLFVQSSIAGLTDSPMEEESQNDITLILPKGELRAHFDVAIGEVNITLSRVKDAISNYQQSNQDSEHLIPVPAYLNTVSGVLSLLEFNQASPLLTRLSNDIESKLLSEDKIILDQNSFDSLADVISGVDYFIESAMQGKPGLDDILHISETALERLESYTTITEDVTTETAESPAPDSEEFTIEIDDEILDIFIDEVNEELNSIREYYPRWKQSSEDIDALGRIRRSFHTLKGSGRMVGAEAIGEFSWAIENLLNKLMNKTVERSPKVIDLLDESTLMLVNLIDAQSNDTEITADWQDLQRRAFELAGSGEFIPDKISNNNEQDNNNGSMDDELLKKNDKINENIALLQADSVNISLEEGLDPEILEIFIEEAKEEIESLNEYYPHWRNTNDHDSLVVIRRSFHTLKGSGRMVGANSIGEFAWSMELLFNRIIEGRIMVTDEIHQAIQQSIGIIPPFIDALENNKPITVDYLALQKANFALAEGEDTDIPILVVRKPSINESQADIAAKTNKDNTTEEDAILAEDIPINISLEEDLDPEILEIFIEEAREEIETLNEYYPHWRDTNDNDALTVIRRSFHTLKGSGRMVGANSIGEFAWSVEKLFNRLIDESIQINDAIYQAIGQSIDIIPPFVNALENNEAITFNYLSLQEVNFDLADGKDVTVPTINITPNAQAETTDGDIEQKSEIVKNEPVEEIPLIENKTLDLVSETKVDLLENEDDSHFDVALPSEKTVALALDENLDPEILEIFIEEAREEIIVLNEYFPRWLENNQDNDALTIIRRSFHTLKGSGRMVGANTIGEFSWSVESLFNAIIDEKIKVNETITEAIASSIKILPTFVSALEKNQLFPFDYLALQKVNFALVNGEDVEVPNIFDGINHDNDHMDVAVSHPISKEVSFLFDEAEEDLDNKDDEFSDQELLNFDEKEELDDSAFLISEFVDEDTKTSDFVESHFGVEMDTVLYDIFLSESLTHIRTIKEFIASCDHCFVTDAVCRAFHTLHGSAHMAEVPSIAELSGAIERFLNSMIAQNSQVSDNFKGLMSYCIENIEDDIRSIGSNKNINNKWKKLVDKVNHHHEKYIESSVERAEIHEESTVTKTKKEEKPAIDPEMVEIFLEEAADLLDALDDSLQEWLADPSDTSHIDAMKRTLHTLKGGARLSGVTALGNLSHDFETFLSDIADSKIEVTDEITALSQNVGDAIADLVDQVAMSKQTIVADENVNKQLQKILHPNDLIDEDDDSDLFHSSTSSLLKEVDSIQPDDSTLLNLSDLSLNNSSTTSNLDTGLSDLNDSKYGFNNKKNSKKSKKPKQSSEKVRVSADLLDNLVNLSGEVSIYRSRLEQQNTSLRFNLSELEQTVTRLKNQLRTLEIETEAQILFRYDRNDAAVNKETDTEDFDPLEMDRFSTMQQVSRSLAETVDDLTSIRDLLEDQSKESDTLLLQQFRVSTELQDGLLRTRMVSFAQVESRLSRLVRQTARSLKKNAVLKVSGEETEIDRGILQRIVGPLEHILRNAVSHGVEEPAKRRELNKPAEGAVHIRLSMEGRDVVIEVGDDGGGLNRDKILETAIEKGLVSADANLSDEDIYQFIAKPGFSTVEQLDQISGRGVGMDVLFSGIKELGGSVEIQSEMGKGSNFIIRLPLTLSITDALLVTTQEERYAILHTSIEGVVRLSREQMVVATSTNTGDEVYEYAGQEYVIRYLGDMLGFGQHVLPENIKWYPALLVKAGRRRIALQVDALLGNRQVVVKPVGVQVGSVPWISGGSILGDGKVALLLDVNALIHADITHKDASEEKEVAKIKTIMVVDDSITVRKVTSRLLKRYDMNIITAKDGLDALDKLEEQIPDVMLLDIEMPRMDGFELATRMKKNDQYKNIPIIMITSRTGNKHRDRALSIGVQRYLGKPFQEAELMENINGLLNENSE